MLANWVSRCFSSVRSCISSMSCVYLRKPALSPSFPDASRASSRSSLWHPDSMIPHSFINTPSEMCSPGRQAYAYVHVHVYTCMYAFSVLYLEVLDIYWNVRVIIMYDVCTHVGERNVKKCLPNYVVVMLGIF